MSDLCCARHRLHNSTSHLELFVVCARFHDVLLFKNGNAIVQFPRVLLMIEVHPVHLDVVAAIRSMDEVTDDSICRWREAHAFDLYCSVFVDVTFRREREKLCCVMRTV